MQHGQRPGLFGHEPAQLYLPCVRHRNVSTGRQDGHALDRGRDGRRHVQQRLGRDRVRADHLGSLPRRKQFHAAFWNGRFGRVRCFRGRLGDQPAGMLT